MPAKIIAIANQKGGVGKSTVSMLLAGTVARAQYKVLVVDSDPQGTATQWSSTSDTSVFPASVISLAGMGSKLHREVQKHVENYDLVIIDCPPSVELQSQSALLIADIAIIPLPPSPPVLWGSRGIKLLIEKAQAVNPDLRGFILLNKVKKTALSRDIQEMLADFGLPVLKNSLRELTAYEEASALGCTVQELGSSARVAIDLVDELAKEILDLLEEV